MVFNCWKQLLNYFKILGALSKLLLLNDNNNSYCYYYFVDAGNPKSQKTLAEIIASKVRLHAMMQKVKDSHPSQIQPKYLPENTVEHVTTTVNEDKEVNGAILDNVVPISHLGPEFRSIKPVASSPSERLPIESVPSTSEEPVGDRATGSKKRSKNKRKARKKLCMENQ